MRSFTLLVAQVATASSFDVVSDDSLSLLQMRATQPGCSAYDPYCGSPPEPDGQVDDDQTPTLAQNGPCFIPPLEANGYPRGHSRGGGSTQEEKRVFAQAASACPNTVDNMVLRGDADYKVNYPDWQCGNAIRIGGPHYGQTDKVLGYTSGGPTYDHVLKEEGWVKDLPWTVHADACITRCKEIAPMEPGSQTYAVTVGWKGLGLAEPVETAVVKKGTAVHCDCYTAATYRQNSKPVDKCPTKVVWVGSPEEDVGAVGDPHMTTISGDHSDVCCDNGICKPCDESLMHGSD